MSIRILFAPRNTASVPAITTKALNKIQGVNAMGISFADNKYWSFDSPNWTIISYTPWRKNPIKRIREIAFKYRKFFSLILWADVLHWHWDIKGETIFDLHYWLIKFLKKPVIVEFVGSDIRIPEVLFELNPYYKECWQKGEYSYYFESRKRSREIQERFKKLNAVPLLAPEMTLFLFPDLFPESISLLQRMDLEELKPIYPVAHRTLPILVHTPSALGAKGTEHLRRVIERLKEKKFAFEYIEITGKTRTEAKAAIQKADIFLDQFICGSYGLAACEAMAFGKPVFCYIMPAVKRMLPHDCPIIDNPREELEARLAAFITDGELRRNTGLLSRKYVEQYHDADTIAKELITIYQNALQRRR